MPDPRWAEFAGVAPVRKLRRPSPLESPQMPPRRLSSLAALLIAFAMPLAAPLAAQRAPSGRVGAYTPPTAWPQRARVFDLLHQRIEIGFDLQEHAVTGVVTTRLVVPAAPTDTVRLDASNLTIDAALDAAGRPLRFTSDTSRVTVSLPARARRGDTVTFTLRY